MGNTGDDEKDVEKLDKNTERVNLIEDLTNCSLNDKDIRYSFKKDIDSDKLFDKESKIVDEEKEIIVKDKVRHENSENNPINNGDKISQKQLPDDDGDQGIYCDNDGDQGIYRDDYGDSSNEEVDVDGDDDGCYDNSDDDDSDDNDGWITPGNISQVKAEFGICETQSKPTNITVGCLTTDFAMQVI